MFWSCTSDAEFPFSLRLRVHPRHQLLIFVRLNRTNLNSWWTARPRATWQQGQTLKLFRFVDHNPRPNSIYPIRLGDTRSCLFENRASNTLAGRSPTADPRVCEEVNRILRTVGSRKTSAFLFAFNSGGDITASTHQLFSENRWSDFLFNWQKPSSDELWMI